MTIAEWSLVIAINGAIIGFGIWKSRNTKTSYDWFLAARGLPWWLIGLSMFATAVDSGDYVAVAGGAHKFGLSYITPWWLGLTLGWILVSFVIFLPMYRQRMYTNAEYLEARFGPSTRLLSVFIQIQNRTQVLANVAVSLFLTFSILTEWQDSTVWCLVVAIAAGAAVYTASGGLRSVVVTDALQSIVMLVASIVMWIVVYQAIGGWAGFEQRLVEANVDQEAVSSMKHVGGYLQDGVPPLLVVFGWIVLMMTYCTVNHSQSMRLLAARSEWDLKMAVVVAVSVTAIIMWFNVTFGIMGRAAFPDLQFSDEIFPKMVKEFIVPLKWGLTGVVVAGLLAGGISTFDSIGSALSAVFTRDFYARFLVRNAKDRHYLTVSRWATLIVIGLSFAYIPLLRKEGMVKMYVSIVGATAVPLFTVYLIGVLTRAHRVSGTVGLIVGLSVGIVRLIANVAELDGPVFLMNPWWGHLWGVLLTAFSMLATSVIFGWEPKAALAGLTIWSGPVSRDSASSLVDAQQVSSDITEGDSPRDFEPRNIRFTALPLLLAAALALIVGILNLVVFW